MDQNDILEVTMKQQSPLSHYRHHQPPPPQNCPRCFSTNTKFCYYNNYSIAQPRYFCKACRRYWTHGGTLRNVPIGGGTRKSKPQKTSSSNDISTTQSGNYLGPDISRVYKGMSNTFIPQMAAVQSLPTGNNQGAALSLHNSFGHLGASVAHFQGMNISSFNQTLIPPRPLSSWIINSAGPANLSAGRVSFWSGATNINGGAHAGSSLNPYQRWDTDYNP